LPLLPLEFEPKGAALDRHVPVAERGQPEAAIQPRIVGIADPDERGIEKVNDGRDDLPEGQAGTSHIALHAASDRRQRMGEVEDVLVFRGVADLEEIRMVAVLLAALRITARGLDVAVRVGADPDIGPGRRHGQPSDSCLRLPIADRATVRIAIGEALAARDAADAGFVVRDMGKPSAAGIRGSGKAWALG